MADAEVASEALGAQPPAQKIARDLAVPVPGAGAEARVESDIAEARKARLERDRAVAPYEKDMARDYQENRKKLEGMSIDKVDLKPWTEKPPEQSPIEAFGSLASVFAGLASMFTHTPATSSMNAMASAINARRKNDLEGYELAHQAWKDNTQLMMERHKIESEDMQRALDLMDKKPQQAAAMIKQIAAKYGDNISETLTEAGMYERIAQLHQSRQAAIDQLRVGEKRLDQEHDHFLMTNKINEERARREEQKQDQAQINLEWNQRHTEKRDEINDQHRAKLDEIAANRALSEEQKWQQTLAANIERNREMADLKRLTMEQSYDKPVIATVTDENGVQSTVLAQQHRFGGGWATADADRTPITGKITNIGKPGESADQNKIEDTAKAIAEYRLAPLSSFTLKTPFGQAVNAILAKDYPDYAAPRYGAIQALEKSFAQGIDSRTIQAINVAVLHLDTMRDLGEALKNGNTPLLNSAILKYREETGDPAPVSFEGAKEIVAKEIAKSIIPGAGGVTERQALSDTLTKKQSPAQLAGIISTFEELMAGQLIGVENKWKATSARDDFMKRGFLLPEAKDQLAKTKTMRQRSENGGKKEVPAKAIEILKAHPETRDMFVKRFGEEAAKAALGK